MDNIHKYRGHILLNVHIEDIYIKWYTGSKEEVYMAYTEAQKRATMKYTASNYERLNLQLRKGKKDEYRAQAAKRGLSLNAYIVQLIEKDMEEDK